MTKSYFKSIHLLDKINNNILDNPFFAYKIFNIEEIENLNLPYKGKNNKQLFINIVEKSNVVIDLSFLTKILNAVQHDIEEDCLLLDTQISVQLRDVLSQNTIRRAIFFGQRPSNIGLHIEGSLYKTIEISGCKLFFAHPLSMIEANGEYKKLLWSEMKNLFEIA